MLARKACEIEIDKLGEPIGKQDQYGCALGGVNFIQFHPDESVSHEVVPLSQAARRQLEDGLAMFYLGGTRSASEILRVQSDATQSDKAVSENLKAMVEQARHLRSEIVADVDVLGPYLHEGWERKRSLSSLIANPAIDEAYERARNAGATGGKLLGAGGSGFLLVYAPNGAMEAVRQELSDFRVYDVGIDQIGTTIIYSD